jgi:hypothetical protein
MGFEYISDLPCRRDGMVLALEEREMRVSEA